MVCSKQIPGSEKRKPTFFVIAIENGKREGGREYILSYVEVRRNPKVDIGSQVIVLFCCFCTVSGLILKRKETVGKFLYLYHHEKKLLA